MKGFALSRDRSRDVKNAFTEGKNKYGPALPLELRALCVVGAGNSISDVGDLLYGEHAVGDFNAVVECSLINGLLCSQLGQLRK